MNKLEKMKKVLVQRAMDIYHDMRYDIEIKEYPEHFKRMGKIIAKVDSYNTLSSLIEDISKGKFDVLGVEPSCDDCLEDLFKEVFS